MGVYVPPKPKRPKSVSETLLEAEEEHFLDCPDADALTRIAAFVLDGIFLFILATSIKRILMAVVLIPLLGSPERASREAIVLFNSVQIAVQVMLFYIINVWSLNAHGGSPAKLIFGLRVINRGTGQRLTLFQAVLREFVGKILLEPLTCGFGLLLPVLRKDARTLHDIVANSEVKKVRS